MAEREELLVVCKLQRMNCYAEPVRRLTKGDSANSVARSVKYWTGHAKSSDGEVVQHTITDKYVRMGKDTKFRAEVAERIGLRFELPKTASAGVVPNVPTLKKARFP